MTVPASARPRLTVAVTRRLPQPVESRMAELFDVRLRDVDVKMSRDELAQAMRDCDVLVPTVTDRVDAALLAQSGERLRLIANYGAGVDHIDVSTARQRGILVANTPGATTEDTADMTIALILAVALAMAAEQLLANRFYGQTAAEAGPSAASSLAESVASVSVGRDESRKATPPSSPSSVPAEILDKQAADAAFGSVDFRA